MSLTLLFIFACLFIVWHCFELVTSLPLLCPVPILPFLVIGKEFKNKILNKELKFSSSYRSSQEDFSGLPPPPPPPPIDMDIDDDQSFGRRNTPSNPGRRLTATTVAPLTGTNKEPGEVMDDEEYLYGSETERDYFSRQTPASRTPDDDYSGCGSNRGSRTGGVLDDIRGDIGRAVNADDKDGDFKNRGQRGPPTRGFYNDVDDRRKFLRHEEMEVMKSKGQCFECGAVGHMSRTCPERRQSFKYESSDPRTSSGSYAGPSGSRQSIVSKTIGGVSAFDKSQYPEKGIPKTEGNIDNRNRPAIYELPKIQKKAKTEAEETEDQEAQITRLKMEHARLELQLEALQKLLERTTFKEDELKRKLRGQSLHDNKEYSDNMKLKLDAQRKYDAAKKDFEMKDIILKKMLAKEPKESEQAAATAYSITNFLDEGRVDIEEPLEEDASKIEFFDGGEHWCQQCNFFGDSIKEFLNHCQTEEHWTKTGKSEAPWPVIRRFKKFSSDRALVAIKGSQFMIPSRGFYCAICKFFCGDLETAEEHMFCVNHNRTIAKFYMSKPEYEHVFNKERQAAWSKAEADTRKKKREAEEKRIREAARKKKQEEEAKQREKETQDKIIEQNKYISRVKDLNERTEKNRRREERDRSSDRNSKRTDRKVYAIESSEDESSLDSIPVRRPDTREDPKIMKGCLVSISYQDQRHAKRALEKSDDKVFCKGKKMLKLVNNRWEEVSSIVNKNPAKQDKPKTEEKKEKPKAITADFDDDSNDNINLSTVHDEITTVEVDCSKKGDEPKFKAGNTTSVKDNKDTASVKSTDTYSEIFDALSSCVGATVDSVSPTKNPFQVLFSPTKPSKTTEEVPSASKPASSSNSQDVVKEKTCGISFPQQVSSPKLIGSPITTLDLDCLTKSPNYMQDEDDI